MDEKQETKLFSFRLPLDVDEKLDYLAKATSQSRTGVIVALINAQYDSLIGNPEMMRVVEQMQELKERMESIFGTTS